MCQKCGTKLAKRQQTMDQDLMEDFTNRAHSGGNNSLSESQHATNKPHKPHLPHVTKKDIVNKVTGVERAVAKVIENNAESAAHVFMRFDAMITPSGKEYTLQQIQPNRQCVQHSVSHFSFLIKPGLVPYAGSEKYFKMVRSDANNCIRFMDHARSIDFWRNDTHTKNNTKVVCFYVFSYVYVR